jgi:mRNA-degrading endonuclease RelE of RelBE toxin-antitoxin system
MAFRVTMATEAEAQWQSLPVREQRILETAIQARLVHQPTTVTKAVKQLRPNPLAQYELRVGDLRVLYNVEGEEIVLLIVGRKTGNRLIVCGEEFHGHQDNAAEDTGSEAAGDAP